MIKSLMMAMAVCLISCEKRTSEERIPSRIQIEWTEWVHGSVYVTRFVDKENGVICYSQYGYGGLWCMVNIERKSK